MITSSYEKYNASNYKKFFNQKCEVCTIQWEHEIDNLAQTSWWMVNDKFYCPDHVPSTTNSNGENNVSR